MAVRPIDGNELLGIERLLNTNVVLQSKTASWLLDQVLHDIQAMPTLTPPNEWVSVENAFPPKNESVLCIVSGKPKPNITLKDAYQLGSWNKADGWIIDEWLDWEGANVTWWMKLPEPPDRRPLEGAGMNYIDRELLLIGVDGCISALHAQAKGDPIQEGAIKLVEATRDYIASLSAADVAPVRHGRWIEDERTYPGPGLKNNLCSVCGEIAGAWKEGLEPGRKWAYCPNCGARMDKEDEP